MQEFMLLIRNEIGYQADWSPEKHEQFLRDSDTYIEGLRQKGRLISARSLTMGGMIVSRADGEWNVRPMRPKGEVLVGHYLVLAESMDEAIGMAKGSPEFDYGSHARVEVRPVQTVYGNGPASTGHGKV
jgi:hypothetical protein